MATRTVKYREKGIGPNPDFTAMVEETKNTMKIQGTRKISSFKNLRSVIRERVNIPQPNREINAIRSIGRYAGEK